ncbi:hypothetical protein CHARACLAT_003967 [Characodon lateralis]|uniref:Secreted protein n=1 Tax=Characodon lateralis TaxID=208331 RepID=A0ABU7EGR1_9TELE|nr:hypothetical protein [Characodon lateralis]
MMALLALSLSLPLTLTKCNTGLAESQQEDPTAHGCNSQAKEDTVGLGGDQSLPVLPHKARNSWLIDTRQRL